MLKEHAKVVARGLFLADVASTVLSFFLAYWIRTSYLTHWALVPLYHLERYYPLLLIIIPVWSYLLHTYDTYRSYRTIPFYQEMIRVWKAVAVGGLFIGAAAFALKLNFLSRTLILTFVVVNIILISLERFSIRAAAWLIRKQGYNYRNVVIVGTGESALDTAERISHYHHWGLRVVGFVSENGPISAPPASEAPVIGSIMDLERIITDHFVDEVIFAVSRKHVEELEDVFLMLEDHGINARIVINPFQHLIAKVYLEELESVPLLTYTTTPTNVRALLLKRIFDLIVSTVLLIGSLPVMGLTALLIKTTSPGPVLFRQKRSGLHGRTFTLLKFRSMYLDAEKRKSELEKLNEMDGPVFKISNDPRITPLGRFIRKTSIDELPQLWNILKGDMSIVGPRPPLPEEVVLYKRWQRRRLSMRPGLTCLWQISGRNQVRKFDDWVKLDLKYIDTWSLGLDMQIFVKTIPVVLFRKGAV